MAPSIGRPMPPTESFELEDELKQTWRSHWLAFCGDCTPTDIISCCTAYCVPCVAYGWTTSRVFRTSLWKELGKYLFIFGIWWLLLFIFGIAMVSTCPQPPGHSSTAGADAIPTFPTAPTAPSTAACKTFSVITVVVYYMYPICAIIWAVRIGGARRTQLRKHLGIAGLGAGGDCCTNCSIGPDKGSSSDCCLHYWCLWCALAQEMRTVMHLHALNRLPVGRDEGNASYEPLVNAIAAPCVDGGMSRVTGVPVATMV